jgi:uncharacterized membrane protein YfcA
MAGLLLLGGAAGGLFGLVIAKRLETRTRTLRLGFAALVLVVATYVVARALGALMA